MVSRDNGVILMTDLGLKPFLDPRLRGDDVEPNRAASSPRRRGSRKLAFLFTLQNMPRMSQRKNSYKFLIALLLAIFLIGRGVALQHSFSHDQDHSHKTEHCSVCSFSNFSSGGTEPQSLIFVVTAFLLLISSREFSRVKLSYLLSSRCSRAPPRIS